MSAVPPFESLGRYRVQAELGAGGMGTVYRAWDPQLARAVAIKVVKYGSSETRARLVREAQSLARLSHPNVCHVYDVGTEGDEVWVAMELIEGSTLRQWATQQTAEALLRALLSAAEGIHAAHQAGMIHRDVKPENVLVTPAGRAVVTDFGLARIDEVVDAVASTVGSGDPRETVATMTGSVAGTPAYLAPEQLTGAPIDARVDQFAWAVMAWELATGMRPFPIIHGARLEAIRAGLTPPPNVPRRLGDALVRALAVAPRDRFASMRELIEAVGQPRAARSRVPLVIGGAVALLAAVGGIVVWQLGSSSREPVSVAPVPSDAATQIPITALAPDAASVAATPTPTPTTPTRTAPIPTTPTTTPPDAAPVRSKRVGSAAPPAIAIDPGPPPPTTPPPPTGAYPLHRRVAEQMLEAFCRLPVDPAKPDAVLEDHRVIDWGKVTRAELVDGTSGDMTRQMVMYEVKGARGTYRFDGAANLSTIGLLNVDPGTLVALCLADHGNTMFEVPAAWSGYVAMTAYIPLSRPPRIADVAKLDPIHISGGFLSKDATNERISLPAGRRGIVRVALPAGPESGTRWKIDNWWLDIPAGIPGHALLQAKKTRWIVVENPQLVPAAGGSKQLVLRAAAVIEDMFPK
ncbi:MAG: serine/threonine protein kinase [Deltaproteobacteria bacterium]|nr:serine/threonine protein kinase [Deltaproteobacteria bacterium]